MIIPIKPPGGNPGNSPDSETLNTLSSEKSTLSLYYYDTSGFDLRVVNTPFLDPAWIDFMTSPTFLQRLQDSVDSQAVAVATVVAQKVNNKLKLKIVSNSISISFTKADNTVNQVIKDKSTTLTLQQMDDGIMLDGIQLIALGDDFDTEDTYSTKELQDLQNQYFVLGEFRNGVLHSPIFNSNESSIDYDAENGEITVKLTVDVPNLELFLQRTTSEITRLLNSKIGLCFPSVSVDDKFLSRGLDEFKHKPGMIGQFVFGDDDSSTAIPIDTILFSERLLAGINDILVENMDMPLFNLIPYKSDNELRLYAEPLLEWMVLPMSYQNGIYASPELPFIPREIIVIGIQNTADIVDYNHAPFGSFTTLPDTIKVFGTGDIYSHSIISGQGFVGTTFVTPEACKVQLTPEYSAKLHASGLNIGAMVVKPAAFNSGDDGGI